MPGQSLRSYGSRWSGPINATCDATGAATARFGPVPDGRRWTVDEMAISSASGQNGSLSLYAGPPLVQNLRGGSATPIADTWFGSFSLNSSDEFSFVWASMSPGALVTVNVHFDDSQVLLVGNDTTLLRF